MVYVKTVRTICLRNNLLNTNEIVAKSFDLASAFAKSYSEDAASDKTEQLLEDYKNERRKLNAEPSEFGMKRPGAKEAYLRTQGC